MTCITAAMLPALLGRPVAYQPVFTRLPGVTVQGAIFLSQALFLCNTPTAQRREGWFWKEQQGDVDSWEAETGMTAKQQVTARRQLVAIGVLEEVRKGVPAKTWYRVDTDMLAQALATALSDDELKEQVASPATGQNLPTGESGNAQQENQESPDRSAQNRPNGVFLQRLQQRTPPPPSDAGEPNQSIFEQSAQQTDDGNTTPAASEHRQFPMTYGWQPDPEQLAMACFRRGLPTDAQPDAGTLADFTAHFAEKPSERRTAQGWHERLAKWLAENRQRQPLNQTATGTAAQGDRHAQRCTTGTGHDPRAERERIRQQLADPLDTSWADGLWPEDDDAEFGTQAGDHIAGGAGIHPAGSDLSSDVLECFPECEAADAGTPGAGAGAGPLAGHADPAGGRAGDERSEASGEYLAADDPGAGVDAGAHAGGLRYAGDW